MVSEHASPLAQLGGADAGGQNVHVASLACHVAARLGTSVVVHTRRDDPRPARRVDLCRKVVVDHVDAGPAVKLPKDDLFPLMGAFAEDLRRAWSVERPDVVHAHFWMSAWATLEAARPLDLPVVVTFHALGSEKRRQQGASDTSPAQRVELEREIAGAADVVVATSSAEVGELESMGATPRRVEVVPCGVDLALFCPDGPSAPRTPGLRRIVVCGRLVERKGVDDVLAALVGLHDVELVVIGGSDQASLDRDPDAARLRRRACSLGVGHRVTLLGAVDHEQLPTLLRSADVVVCAPWYEPFGMVALEAMACARPVVATRVGGLADTVLHGQTGLLVPRRDPTALAGALRTVLDDREQARRFGLAGRRRACSTYSWDTVATATFGAYAQAIRSGILHGVRG
jgi:D-inositol-3-phosphate glycosyltransferase